MLAPELGAIEWRKSSYSGGGSGGGDCIEVADLAARTAIRDSKNPHGPALVFRAEHWNAFVGGVKSDHRA
ncbi:DUF397 domain-containing protein [Streptomyces fulvoviolaceus]|uniref:DUF397 domain-containing protein n=1 Tax=Streptomyces fulvoviolaceus TaxID=285535 RepID=UPI0021C0D628|nr:DUF397 domain-containing protein [Streptomyces fulvoviolaceus]MCT9084454.1 DUF397 domain-containing protein [Streptomyces fulvoviolaceus]